MNKDLDKKLKDLEKNFGLKRASTQKEVETIRTGIYALDYVIDGIKLCEGGHKLEFYGNESSGKTTFALKVVKKFQELGKTCVWVVSESFHGDWAKKLGVDTSKLLLAYPESVEDATETILGILNQADLIVVDSVASLIPEAEAEKTMHEQTRGLQAKAYSQFCRKLYQIMTHKTTTMIFINQIRMKMNVIYGNPEDTPCGKALKFMYDTRIEFRAGKAIENKIKETEKKFERVGMELTLYGKKNKLGKAHRRAVLDFYFKDGTVNNKKNLVFAGIKYSIIDFAGKTYQFGKIKAVGKDNFIKKIEDKDWEAISEEVWKRLR